MSPPVTDSNGKLRRYCCGYRVVSGSLVAVSGSCLDSWYTCTYDEILSSYIGICVERGIGVFGMTWKDELAVWWQKEQKIPNSGTKRVMTPRPDHC